MQFFYVVRPGDTLSEIAKRWEIPIDSLLTANNLKATDKINRGQQLSMPPGVDMYKVKTSDSVFRIAQLYGVPLANLIEANELKPPYILQVNQLLKIPSGVPYYIVQLGDTLDQIAERYNVKTEGENNPGIIKEFNKLQSTEIYPGMKLAIPYGSTGLHGFIAYTTNRDGQYDIWVYNLHNGEDKQLTTGLGDSFSQPVWSPDSSRIAFIGKDRIIYVIYVSTGLIAGVDQLSEGGDLTLDWSPNSDQIAYAARGIIVLYNAALHETMDIIQPGASDVGWFPSGTELLFQALDISGVSQLYRCGLRGTDKQQLTKNTEGPLHNVRLSPDGSYVLYTTPGASTSIINTVEISTGKVFELKGGSEAKNYFPVWSPDSQEISYSATGLHDQSYFSQIRTVERQGENDRIWAISNCFSTPVTWLSDGEDIAYLSGCRELEFANEIWSVNIKRPVPIRLIEKKNIMSLQCSPTEVVYVAKKERQN